MFTEINVISQIKTIKKEEEGNNAPRNLMELSWNFIGKSIEIRALKGLLGLEGMEIRFFFLWVEWAETVAYIQIFEKIISMVYNLV